MCPKPFESPVKEFSYITFPMFLPPIGVAAGEIRTFCIFILFICYTSVCKGLNRHTLMCYYHISTLFTSFPVMFSLLLCILVLVAPMNVSSKTLASASFTRFAVSYPHPVLPFVFFLLGELR